ncbi:MAG: GDP-L-fucose synthase [Peptococcaceae bacterium BRH_c4a]|nr:MAG: GDP-L-fucose synthase [Peptococcaceae bacterium BRH_c4a]
MSHFANKLSASVYVAGHRGLVGSAIVRLLTQRGYNSIIMKSSGELDLRRGPEVDDFFRKQRPEYVFLAAGRVGGIYANSSYPAQFIYDNLMIQSNVIDAAFRHRVKKLLFLGSSCIYPRCAPQPIREEYLLTGALEPTNEPYAVAKIAGIKMCQAYNQQYGADFISVMPTNLYGPEDNFNPETSHVLPALIRKFHEARERGGDSVTVWGTGQPRREFLHVDDLADACLFLMRNYSGDSPVNAGAGEDLPISELAGMIREVVGYRGEIRYDHSKPDGAPRKLLDVSRLRNMGWQPKISLEEGLKSTYQWYLRSTGQGAGTRL